MELEAHFTFSKTLDHVEDVHRDERIEDTAVAFIHVEAEDEERKAKVVKKAVANLKWYLNKVNKERMVLHSFAHLSSSKSSPELAIEVISAVRDKMDDKGFEVHSTVFGYFSEFSIHVRGESLAKVFKEI